MEDDTRSHQDVYDHVAKELYACIDCMRDIFPCWHIKFEGVLDIERKEKE